MPYPILITAFAFLLLCCATDLRTRRIPNVITLSAMVGGIALNGLYFGFTGLGFSVAGLLIAFLLLLTPFALGGVGGGDVKMMAAVGALLGPRLGLAGLAIGVILGGVMAVVHLAGRGRLREKLHATWSMFFVAAVTRSVSPLKVSANEPGAVALPYSVPLALGTISVLIAAVVMRGGH